jgi:hypothetical protein
VNLNVNSPVGVEARADESASSRWALPKQPRHVSTLHCVPPPDRAPPTEPESSAVGQPAGGFHVEIRGSYAYNVTEVWFVVKTGIDSCTKARALEVRGLMMSVDGLLGYQRGAMLSP